MLKKKLGKISLRGLFMTFIVVLLLVYFCLLFSPSKTKLKLTYDMCNEGTNNYAGTKNMEVDSAVTSESFDVAPNTSSSNASHDNTKLIKTYNYEVESTKFNKYSKDIKSLVSKLGGNIQSERNIQTDKTDSKQDNTYNVRKSILVINIPISNLEKFKKEISSNAIVVNRTESIEDATNNYINVKAHIKSYEAEYKKLKSLLSDAKTVSEVIEIQDRLSDISYQLESYKSSLKALNDNIDYCELTLTIDEVIYYYDTTNRLILNLRESWNTVFNDWLSYVVPMIFLLSVSLIPIWISLGVAISFFSKVVYKNRVKYKQTIIIKNNDGE